MPVQFERLHSKSNHQPRVGLPRALLIGVRSSGTSVEGARASLRETEALAHEAGLEIAFEALHTRASSSVLFGPGKLRELASLTGGPGHARRGPPAAGERAQPQAALAVDYVVVDCVLTPRQQQELERALARPVIDRTALILRLFARRARTREASLAVELSALRHQLPRLSESVGRRDKQAGGGGRGERGHTEVRLQKQRLRLRIAALERELAQRQRSLDAQRAQRAGLRRVAIVGYTNAGKSSWLRALSGSEVLVADKPFATLGTTVRALGTSGAAPTLLCDTVGFVRDLPHELIASYAATLEEIRTAQLLLWVVDANDPDLVAQLDVTERTLEAAAAGDTPRLLLINKADRVDATKRAELAALFPAALCVSAMDDGDVALVRARLASLAPTEGAC